MRTTRGEPRAETDGDEFSMRFIFLSVYFRGLPLSCLGEPVIVSEINAMHAGCWIFLASIS